MLSASRAIFQVAGATSAFVLWSGTHHDSVGWYYSTKALCWGHGGGDGDPDWGTVICRRSTLTLLHPFWCVDINKPLSASSFSTSHPWKTAWREETYHHLLISIVQTLPVPGTTNSRFGCKKCLIVIKMLTQCWGSQGSIDGKTGVVYFSPSCSHVYREGSKQIFD